MLGLRGLLVYFDPWIAGVLMPTLIVAGLAAVPYIDNNPRGVGYYSLRERPFANAFFIFGIVMWFVLIAIGTFMRGPNWAWYWPWEDWIHHKPPPPPTWSLPNLAGVLALGCYFGLGLVLPKLVRKDIPFRKACWTGTAAIAAAAVGLKFLLAALGAGVQLGWGQLLWLVFSLDLYYLFGFLMPQKHIRDLSWARYVLTMFFLLATIGVMLKVGLRLRFHLQ